MLFVNSLKFGMFRNTALFRNRSVMAAMFTCCCDLSCHCTALICLAASSMQRVLNLSARNFCMISSPLGM